MKRHDHGEVFGLFAEGFWQTDAGSCKNVYECTKIICIDRFKGFIWSTFCVKWISIWSTRGSMEALLKHLPTRRLVFSPQLSQLLFHRSWLCLGGFLLGLRHGSTGGFHRLIYLHCWWCFLLSLRLSAFWFFAVLHVLCLGLGFHTAASRITVFSS